MLMENDTHKVKVSILRYLPVVWEDILGLDVVSRLFLLLVVVVVFLLLGCFVRVLLVKIVHEGWTNGLLGGGMSCGGETSINSLTKHISIINMPEILKQNQIPTFFLSSLLFKLVK